VLLYSVNNRINLLSFLPVREGYSLAPVTYQVAGLAS